MRTIWQRMVKAVGNAFGRKKKDAFYWHGAEFPVISDMFLPIGSHDAISIQPFLSKFNYKQSENMYTREVIIEKTGFRTKTETADSHVQIFYLDYKLTTRTIDGLIATIGGPGDK